jgi:two-component system response regulator NreC
MPFPASHDWPVARQDGLIATGADASKTWDGSRPAALPCREVASMRAAASSILYIEDDSPWCELIETAIRGWPGARRFTAAATTAQGLRDARTLTPEIILLDLPLPDADGFALARELSRLPHRPRLLLLSARSHDAVLFQAGQAHISGLLWKTPAVTRVLPVALQEVAAGRRFLLPEVGMALRRLRADSEAFFKFISERELELLPIFGLGCTDDEIAARVGLSPLTVKSHRQHILAKLGLHRSVDLVHWAIRSGFAAHPALATGRLSCSLPPSRDR